ncbi:MAG: ATP-binding protein, partial [Fimbriimonadales bacterium]|nr:ATP-binding protein [Fimbriimonadales bacterium]
MRRKKSEEQRRLERIAAQAHRHLEQNAPLTPCYASVLVGREAELEQIRQWHENPQARWLTLTGPSGIGKTHLACEFLQRARSWGWLSVYVNLTAEDDPRQILVALFHALNLPFPEDESWKTILAQVFRRPALIVLDDFSRLLERQPRAGVVVLLQRAGSRSSFTSVAQVVQAILEVAPQVKVLATSQRPLELPTEQTLPLRPLPTPPDDWSGRTLEALRAYPSAAVLLNQITDLTRLSRVPPAELAALCRELQGHPGRLVNAGLYLNACPWSRFSQQYRR